MRRTYEIRKNCSHPDCKEWTFYTYSTRKEYDEACKRHHNKDWFCSRHSSSNEVLSLKHNKTDTILICKQLKHGKFWQKIENFGTEKCESGFQYGNGYKAFAEDFPEGTRLNITAEILKEIV